MSHKGIHNPFFEIRYENHPPFFDQLIKNMSKKLIQKSPKYFTVDIYSHWRHPPKPRGTPQRLLLGIVGDDNTFTQ